MGTQVGKLGPAVGSLWKGRQVYRAHNPFVHNPRTAEQTQQRTRFSAMSKLARALSPAINFGFAYQADSYRTTTRGLFTKGNFDAVHTDGGGSVTIDYSDLFLSSGPLTSPSFGAPVFDETPLTVTFSMQGNASQGAALATDKIVAVVYCPDRQAAAISTSTARSANSVSVVVPEDWDGMKVHVYAFAMTTVEEPTFVEGYNGNVYPKMVSECTYIGTGNIS